MWQAQGLGRAQAAPGKMTLGRWPWEDNDAGSGYRHVIFGTPSQRIEGPERCGFSPAVIQARSAGMTAIDLQQCRSLPGRRTGWGVDLSSTTKHERPLSPFMTYRFQYTMVFSFMHRVSGCALSVGLILLVCWLASIASGEDSHARLQLLLSQPLGKLVLLGFSYAFFYHMFNGVRHLVWDSGRGFEKRTARLSGWSVFIAAVLVTICFWALMCLGGGAA